MKLSTRYISISIFTILMVSLLVFSPFKKLSTNLISLLPQNEETKLLQIYEKFKSSREILVALKSDKLADIKELEKRVLKNDSIKLKESFFTNKEFRKYIKEYQFYLQNFDEKNIVLKEEKLQKSYENLITNPYYNSINQKDPLSLFSQKKIKSSLEFKNGHIYLKDYGYMSVFTFEEGTNFQKVYDIFEQELKEDVMIFSPIFYFVENSKAIKFQVNFLIFIAIFILIILYVVILRNLSLLFNTIFTLLNSSVLALLVVTFIWDEISIFVMVFGMAISTIAIDYMFHHYFCGFYEKEKGFNRAVFYGFLSTFLAFFIISFVDFPFIKQVSIYALVSLSFSYVIFSFLFPKIGFTCKTINQSLPSFKLFKNYKYFSIILVVFMVYTALHVEMDLDVKNLDYQNVELKEKESFFRDKLQSENKIPFVIKAQSIDELIDKSIAFKSLHVDSIVPLANLLSKAEFYKKQEQFEKIDFETLREELTHSSNSIGFRKGLFKDSYPQTLLKPKEPKLDIKTMQSYGFDVEFDGEFYYSFGFIEKTQKVEGVYLINSAKLFEKSLNRVSKELMISGLIILFSIVIILYIVTKENFFKALSFVLFPISLILFVISFSGVNILQIFMIFVIVSLSIDYGIYMSQKEVDIQSQRAILFSLMSTFAGFGVLVFSSIGVLFYIGEVATLGLLAILIMLILGKR